jgi:hypothetical protein
MENTIQLQPEKIFDDDALFLASSILTGAHRTIRDIQILAAALIRYALIGASITDNLIGLMATDVPEEHWTRDHEGPEFIQETY